MVTPAKKREVVTHITEEHGISIRQACKSLQLERSSYYYESRARNDKEIISELNQLAEEYPTYGFKKMYHLLRNKGYVWNHKRIYRVYKELGMNLTRKRKRRLPVRKRHALESPEQVNQVWSMDFMSDALYSNRRFRTLNIIDDYNRECLWIEAGLSIGSKYMVNLLDWIIQERGKPKAIRVDNGPEFISANFTNFCHKHRIEIRYIQPGKPVQNAFIERFNRSYRTEVLDVRRFENLVEVRELTNNWIEHYNTQRPHESLGNISPREYLLKEDNSPATNPLQELSPV